MIQHHPQKYSKYRFQLFSERIIHCFTLSFIHYRSFPCLTMDRNSTYQSVFHNPFHHLLLFNLYIITDLGLNFAKNGLKGAPVIVIEYQFIVLQSSSIINYNFSFHSHSHSEFPFQILIRIFIGIYYNNNFLNSSSLLHLYFWLYFW